MVWDIIAIIVLIVALLFLLTNGLHDASSVVATIIACGAATPVQAISLAAIAELLGALLGGTAVTQTIVSLINLPTNHYLLVVLLSALLAAVAWNVITWQLGLPSSSTHALVGGLIGAVWAAAGSEYIVWGFDELWFHYHLTGVMKIIISLLISPLIGFLVSLFLQKIVELLLRRATFAANIWLKRLQWIIAAILAFNHGSNDTQKILGLVVLVLLANNWAVQTGVMQLLGGIIMCCGILFGGWTIIKTLGRKIFPLEPIHSFNSLFSSGISILSANILGAPISTTHLVAGTIIGVGTADNYRMVNWQTGQEMIVAWFITIPASGFAAAFCYRLVKYFLIG